MPILFLLSGSVAALSFKPEKAEKKGNKYLVGLKFLKIKALRLLVPLLFGTFIVVLPTKYYGREYAPLKMDGSPRDYSKD
jgi:hypothetical protein